MTSPHEEGSPSAKLLILGEAPARVEMRLGRPFVGEAGDVFNNCLHAAGLARRECYILNVFPFPVWKNKKTQVIYDKEGGAMLWHPKKGLTVAGEDASRITMEKIYASSCNVVLALGSTALDFCTGGHRPIMKWRSSTLWGERINRKILATVHPASTLWGTYTWRYLIAHDMAKVRQFELNSASLDLPKRNYRLRPTISDVFSYMQECRNAGRFATDLEVVNRQVYCFSLSYDPMDSMTVPLVDPKGDHYWDEDDEEHIWKIYAELMRDESIMKVNQNILGFDSVFFLNYCNIHTRGPIGDCMIANSIVYPEFPKGLDFIATLHTREPYWKDDGKIHKKLEWDYDRFHKYCGTDAAVALESWIELEKEMRAGGYWATYEMTVDMWDQLAYMSIDGLPVNKKGLSETNAYLDKLIAEKERALHEACGRELNANSFKQCAEYFYEHLGIPPYKNREGGYTTDDKAMSRIVRRASTGSKEARLVQEVRKYRKLKNTYMEVELDDDDMLRCSWNPRGTWTGRLSSSQTIFGTGMNLQNLDPEFKAFVVAG